MVTLVSMGASPAAAPTAPKSLRIAAAIAVITLIVAGGSLYQENIRSEQPPDFGRGGAFAGDLAQPGDEEITIVTPTPRPVASGRARSTAVLSAPNAVRERFATGRPPPFPALGRYVYRVDGSESASIFGSRDYPPEMTMTVHRSPGDETGQVRLKDDELAFDLNFSQDHEEREIVAFRRSGIAFTYEAGSITFGPRTESSEATYSPAMTQIPIPLTDDAKSSGTSRALRADGSTARVENWTVDVVGRERLNVMNETVEAYVVEIERKSEPGSEEQLTRTRKYWFDPARVIWVQWEEQMSGTRGVGFGSFTYSTRYTATLERIEPL